MTSFHSQRACAAQGVRSVAIGGALCPSDTANQRVTAGDMGTDDQCSPSSATCQSPSVPISATCQCRSVPHQCHISVPI
ncbi:unnamed protein product [Staurois parvus]|uniref:Uncharacterized protein n=1 Tax=Staurois parvus TaxID=386267 RepID=A0ABN9F692_9NEOB|nr:unnamed protein product [Staurois parvus]